MKKLIFIGVVFMFISGIFHAGCGESPGNPELVKAMQEITEKVCACTDKACIDAIIVNGKNVSYYKNADTMSLNRDQKVPFSQAMTKMLKCEKQIIGGIK